MAVPPDVVDLWWHYEELAMHFNGLIMQFRVQVLGGAGALGTVAGYLINTRIEDHQHRAHLGVAVGAGLWILLFAAALLDVFYYRQLLEGTVKAIIDLETKYPEIQASTEIQRAVGRGTNVIWWFYGILLLALGGFTFWSWYESGARTAVTRGREDRPGLTRTAFPEWGKGKFGPCSGPSPLLLRL